MNPDSDRTDDDTEAGDDPALNELADAILDGRPVDWQSTTPGAASEYLDQLRVLAELGLAQRRSPDAGDSPGRRHTPPSPPIGRWGNLHLLERIGAGAFGEVFRAWDPHLDREVALKLLYPHDAGAAGGGETVIEEGRLLARVRHANVVTVYGAERADGRIGVWTEFIRGETLAAEAARRGVFSAADAVAVGRDLCRALSAVHEAGLLHRDIKSQNVMRADDGRLVLLDFGAGRDQLNDTLGGHVETAGTPLYVAPELWKGGDPTPQSDVYSAGVLLFHLLTGGYPIEGATLTDVRDAHRNGAPPRSLAMARPDLPRALIHAVARATAPAPEDRYETVGALEAALTAITEKRNRSQRRRRAAWAAALVVVFAAATYLVRSIVAPGSPATEARRLLPSDVSGVFGGPSLDGRYAAFVDTQRADVWLVSTATGRARRVTNAEATGGTSMLANVALPSPDGRRIAYLWKPRGGQFELLISNPDGRDVLVLVPASVTSMVQPLSWSRDGSMLLCLFTNTDRRRDLALVSTSGGPPRILEAFRGASTDKASLSPDGNFVVFDDVTEPGGAQHDIFIIRTAAPSSRHALAPHPANDTFPVWTSDGRVVFLSERGGHKDAWALPITAGAATGDAVRVAAGLDETNLFGVSLNGTLFYLQRRSTVDVHTADVDLDRAQSIGRPAPLPGKLGDRIGGTWSPDGAWMGYSTAVEKRFGLIDLRTGAVSLVLPPVQRLGNFPPRWAPNSKSFLFSATDLENRIGYFQWDLAHQSYTPALLFGSASQTAEAAVPPVAWSSDGASILYFQPAEGIVRRTLSNGDVTTIIKSSDLPVSGSVRIAVSRDGRSLAISGRASRDGSMESGLWISVNGGAAKKIVDAPSLAILQEWTSDQRYLTYTQQPPGSDAWHLFVVTPNGGPPRDLGELPGYATANRGVFLSPDMQRVAYTQGQRTLEVWMIEHFLPPVGRR